MRVTDAVLSGDRLSSVFDLKCPVASSLPYPTHPTENLLVLGAKENTEELAPTVLVPVKYGTAPAEPVPPILALKVLQSVDDKYPERDEVACP